MGKVISKVTFSQKVADEICSRLAEGEPLRQICRDKHMPSWQAVYQWIEKYEDFARHIARARKLGFDAIAEEALEIADTPILGEETEETDDGKTKTKRGDMLGHRKLQVETRLKLLAKWCPQLYGDRSSMALTGPDGGPVQISDAERGVKAAGLLALAEARRRQQEGDDDASDHA